MIVNISFIVMIILEGLIFLVDEQ